MKYLLILHLCSVVTQTCPNMMYPEKVYNTWSDCANAGYELAQATFSQLDKNVVNQQQLALKFECKEISNI